VEGLSNFITLTAEELRLKMLQSLSLPFAVSQFHPPLTL
jgi:hypothetical protein